MDLTNLLLDILGGLGGGRGEDSNILIPHWLALMMWLGTYIYWRTFDQVFDSDFYPYISLAILFSVSCEGLHIIVESLRLHSRWIPMSLDIIWPAIKQGVTILCSLVQIAAFLALAVRSASLGTRWLLITAGCTSLAFLVTSLFWWRFSQSHSDTSFLAHGSAMVLPVLAIISVAVAFKLLHSHHKRTAIPVATAFSLIGIAYLWQIMNILTGGSYSTVLTPLQNNFLLWSIPFMTYAVFQISQGAAKQQAHGRMTSERLEALGQLSAGIAHDFNNHLQIILGYVELARVQGVKQSDLPKMLDGVEDAAVRAGSLVNQLLAFNRGQKTTFEPVDLNETVSELLPMLSRLLGPGINLIEELDPNCRAVKGDRRLIEQIIINLVLNARDALSGNGDIRLITDSQGKEKHDALFTSYVNERCQLIVRDNGTGMDETTRHRAFEPFFTTKKIGEGTGLGLATIYGIVQKHRGEVTIESEPGQYTEVCVELPIAETVAIRESNGIDQQRGNETILLLEDEASIRDMITTLLDNAGYKVLVASDGQHAINIALTNSDRIDLGLFDVIMPERSGYQIYDELQKRGVDLPIIFVTGGTARAEAMRQHHTHIQKPFTHRALLGTIRTHLDAEDSQ